MESSCPSFALKDTSDDNVNDTDEQVAESHIACDICGSWMGKELVYCGNCKQKMCESCSNIHAKLGATLDHVTVVCYTSMTRVDAAIISKLQKDGHTSLSDVASELMEYLGLQVAVDYVHGTIQLLAMTQDVLSLAKTTVQALTEPEQDVQPYWKRLHHGNVEWVFKGEKSLALIKLFQAEIYSLCDEISDLKCELLTPDAEIELNDTFITAEQSDPLFITQSEPDNPLSVLNSVGLNQLPSSDPDQLQVVFSLSHTSGAVNKTDNQMNDFFDQLTKLNVTEVIRPKDDAFRVKLYTLMKEASKNVICTMQQDDRGCKLTIKAKGAKICEEVRQEFLSLFCKQCSSCSKESLDVTYLECKHVVCPACLKTSNPISSDEQTTPEKITSPDNTISLRGQQCPLCCKADRKMTPVISLQLQCLHVLEKVQNKQVKSGTTRNQNLSRKPLLSAKIPKYVLNKWKTASGGLRRLRSTVENNYGLKVAGSEENLKIYGQIPEILELAIHSLDKINDKPQDSGFTLKLVDKAVEWRFKGEQAQIVNFLFPDELCRLKTKFKSIRVQAFTEITPAVVDIRCGFKEYLKVRYEIEELENAIRNLFTDEYIQPKTFYYNVKVKEYLRNKRRDNRVHCSLTEKNNLNVVVFKSRKKSYIQRAKDELAKI